MKVARIRTPEGAAATAVVDDDVVHIVGEDHLDVLLAVLAGEEVDPTRDIAIDDVVFLRPVERPSAVRDFMIFEQHVANARARTGGDVPEAWYRAPAFYFSNPAGLVDPGVAVQRPRGSRALDFELEVACIIGREVSDLYASDSAAIDAVAGFVLMNDWSARDLQMVEMQVGLGPAKGKDFATSLGPWVVSPDELGECVDGRWSCRVDAYVGDRHVGGADIASAHFGWNDVIARASENTSLSRGDVIGSGTVGTGCLIELRELGRREENPWLADGDVVELRGGALGTLRNTIAPSRERDGRR
jgi:fumarylacetoacetate (FAA) hydrolase